MIDDDGAKPGWNAYRPSKTLWFWSCVGCVVATMVVGFTWGGWVTGATAADHAAEARAEGRAALAAAICVERFVSAPDAQVQLATLKDESSWGRDDMLEDGGWTTPLGLDKPIDGAADLCAEQLVALELPADEAMAGKAPGIEAN